MNKRSRQRLLTLAKFLERLATRIRAFVKSRTPKRGPNKNSSPQQMAALMAKSAEGSATAKDATSGSPSAQESV